MYLFLLWCFPWIIYFIFWVLVLFYIAHAMMWFFFFSSNFPHFVWQTLIYFSFCMFLTMFVLDFLSICQSTAILLTTLTMSLFSPWVQQLHILPREILGISTFGLSMWLLKWFPMKLVDAFLLLCSWLILGDTEKYGLSRPKIGPLKLKNITGKTPVLDVGTLSKIKSGQIKVLILFSIPEICHHYHVILFLILIQNIR